MGHRSAGHRGLVAVLGAAACAAPNPSGDSEPPIARIAEAAVRPTGWVEQARLEGATAEVLSMLGASIDTTEDHIVAGAPSHQGHGAAFFFSRAGTSWTEQPLLLAPVTHPSARFGEDVALAGDWVVVGAPGDPSVATDAGGAHVFELVGGVAVHRQALGPTTPLAHRFGSAVAIDGDTLVVGAPGTDRVHVLSRVGPTWTDEAELTPTDALVGIDFGISVAIDGDRLLVGATLDDAAATDAGAIYVFDRVASTWTGSQKLTRAAAATDDELGLDLSLAGTRAVATYRPPGGLGGAVVFADFGSGLIEEAHLRGADTVATDSFGSSVAITDGFVAVGAPGESAVALSGGATYLFTLGGSTWSELGKVAPGDPKDIASFGSAVAFDGDRLAVGAFLDSPNLPETGAAYAFVPIGADCASAAVCPTGHCVDGVCCESACDAECASCRALDTGAADGRCTDVTSGTDPAMDCGGALACVAGACAATCTGQGECVASHHCDAGTCVPDVPPGESCTMADECTSGFCVDGVCCDAACDAPCWSCRASASGAPDGACSPVLADTDPDDDCEADGGYPASCLADGSCDGAGACRTFAVPGTLCGSQSCAADALVADACDGTGGCIPAASSSDCAPFTCVGSQCTSACAADGDCAASAYCDSSGVCRPREASSTPCTRAGQCASGFCVDGVCCSGPCTGQCEACDSASARGTCVPVIGDPHGPRAACPGAAPDAPCVAARCDGTERAFCAGFVGPEEQCRAATCAAGIATAAAACDGQGACADRVTKDCAPYRCDGDACASACSTDADCTAKFRCSESQCVPRAGAECAGDDVVRRADGTEEDCSPYRCAAGACLAACAATTDCAAGARCDTDTNRCVRPQGDAENDGACALGRAPPRWHAWPWLCALVLAASRRRR